MELFKTLRGHGQSVWLDEALTDFQDPRIQTWIQEGKLTGLVSSKGLFPGAQVESLYENPDLRLLAHAGLSAEEVLKALVVEGFRNAADALLPIFEASNGEDGFITIDIDPCPYPDQEVMYNSIIELWNLINRPNVLISIPADREIIPLFAELFEQGINLNASMICSLEQYLSVVEVYLQSLEARLEAGKGIEHIVSIASFLIGDADKQINELLGRFTGDGVEALRAGALIDEVGLAIAKLAYAQFNVSFNDERYLRLAQAGGRVQRIVWTGFGYRDRITLWENVQRLISPGTLIAVNLEMLDAPPADIDFGGVLEQGLSEARGKLQALESIGISMEQVAEDVVNSHMETRRHAYLDALNSIGKELHRLVLELEPIQHYYGTILSELEAHDVCRRIWQVDASLWPQERRASRKISSYAGWLELPDHLNLIMEDCRAFSRKLSDQQIATLSIVCSGSVGEFLSALSDRYKQTDRTLNIIHPGSMGELDGISAAECAETYHVFVVDGANRQVISGIIEAVWKRYQENGCETPADHLAVVAGPEACQFIQKSVTGIQQIFMLPEDIPFHFSALSYPGMLGACWLNIELEAIGDGLAGMMNRCLPTVPTARNAGIALAAAIEAGNRAGVKRLELSADGSWLPFITWIESLLSEASLLNSSGLQISRSDAPGTLESLDGQSLGLFLSDKAMIPRHIDEETSLSSPVKILEFDPCPQSLGELVGQFLFATAVLGHLQKVNPFDRLVQ
ncbi:MAG: transaldolase family protein [Anaerolineales bacterium]